MPVKEITLKANISAAIIAALSISTTAPCKSAEHEQILPASELRKYLTGRLIYYSPPKFSDSDVHEEFHEDGSWKGVAYSRGPSPFAGRWFIRDNQLCVSANTNSLVAKWFEAPRCRIVKRGKNATEVLIEHLNPHKGDGGFLHASIKDLKSYER